MYTILRHKRHVNLKGFGMVCIALSAESTFNAVFTVRRGGHFSQKRFLLHGARFAPKPKQIPI